MKYVFLLVLLLTTGCTATTKCESQLLKIEVPELKLQAFKWDVPRDEKGQALKSNIYLGLTKTNYMILQSNIAETESHIKTLRSRIDVVNEYRSKN